jgi:hypothetical protein
MMGRNATMKDTMTGTRKATLILCVGVFLGSLPVSAAEPTSAEIFERRILPIFKSPNPSSCTECHLAGVDLKSYILPSHEKTFLSLRDQGLVDLDNPGDSKILRLIAMGGTNGLASDGAALISAKVRPAEHDAFGEWIRARARAPKLRTAPRLTPDEFAQPMRPLGGLEPDFRAEHSRRGLGPRQIGDGGGC